ncbi:MAG: hypothetical protein ACLTEE_01720 [Anaerobutyricum hallii]
MIILTKENILSYIKACAFLQLKELIKVSMIEKATGEDVEGGWLL